MCPPTHVITTLMLLLLYVAAIDFNTYLQCITAVAAVYRDAFGTGDRTQKPRALKDQHSSNRSPQVWLRHPIKTAERHSTTDITTKCPVEVLSTRGMKHPNLSKVRLFCRIYLSYQVHKQYLVCVVHAVRTTLWLYWLTDGW